MTHPLAGAALVAAVACVASGCGAGEREPAARSAAETFVASPTVGPGTSARLFAIPRLGRFGARCEGDGRAEISFRAQRGSATQLVTVGPSNGWLDPGERRTVVIDRARPRADWQLSLLSKGAIEVASVSVTVGRVAGGPFCFVTAKADVGRGSR